MALIPGTRLGVYEVTALIGEGGMGQVYRAMDTTLGRQVAIKILPDAFASDPERLARFEREATTLASLNHPHIAAIYAVERSAGLHALVMEFVEGDDLSQRIARGAIPLDEALAIAKQIAEALEAAHEQGIIHRDLKPANIKVRSDGTVKVLDFGLAKAIDAVGSASNVSQSPTITTPAMSHAGIILGTAAYMSPEQAKGRPVDRRADVWAFGAVLYEILTGQRAFGGEDVSDTLANVLKREPDWERLPADVPARIRLVLCACLQKNTKQRIGDVQDVRLALEGAFESVAPLSVENAGAGRPSGRRALPVALAVVLTAALTLGGVWSIGPAPAPRAPVAQFQVALPDGQALPVMVSQSVAISLDGTRMVYRTGTELYLRAITDVEAHKIPGMPSSFNSPVFSPDGEFLAFHVNSDTSLKRIPVRGGQPLTIAQGVAAPSGMTWGESGIVFGQRGQGGGGVFRVSPNGGMPERLAAVGANEVAYGPQVLPGGEFMMFTLARNTGADRWDRAQIVVQSLASGERRIIINGGSDARYLPTGHIIYAVAGTMFAVAFDLDSQAVHGEAVAVVAGVRRSDGGEMAATQLSVSKGGSLFFVPGPLAPTTGGVLRVPTVTRRSGKPEPLTLPPRPYVRPRVSPDGKRLAVGIDDGTDADVWIYDLSGTSAIQRLTRGGHNRFPVWSPDGRRVTFQSDRDGTASIYAQASDGGGVAERLTTAAQDVSHVAESWSPDGRTLLFSEQNGGTFSLMALSIADKRAVPFGGVQTLEAAEAVFSPDGRWVAYGFNQRAGGAVSPDRGILVQPFPATGAIHQVPKIELDFHPVWGPSGREIFYVSTVFRKELTGVGVQTQPSLSFGSPVTVAGVPQPGVVSTQPRGYDILPDGRFISLLPAENTSKAGAQSEMRVVLNWFDELKRLVPTK